MALAPLTGQTDQVVSVFRAVCTVLQTDPALAALGITWRTWTGDPDDAAPPTTGEMPWVRVSPDGLPMDFYDETAWDGNFKIKFEIATQGTNFDDLGNLFGLFRKALSFEKAVQQTTALTYLRSQGAVTYKFEAGALAPLRQPNPDPESANRGVTDLIAVGRVAVRLILPT